MRYIHLEAHSMTRKEELIEAVHGNTLLIPLVSDMVYLEEQLEYLQTLPKIRIHPDDPSKQKATPAAKLYKELLQQYTNIVKVMLRATGSEDIEEDSPLRKWMNEHINTT
jgi:hypothetical protein